jgi:predicted phosphodiesterase
MCDAIARQRGENDPADFILATGDVAFSGKGDEYKLAIGFFDAISSASGVPKDRIFCIPGNHDIERERQKLCFHGARHILQSQSHVDSLLWPGEELETLLRREQNYRKFQESYFAGQKKTWAADGLGYVSCISIADVRLAIVGLDSAWLAEGGLSDHGKLLIGERQAINALSLAGNLEPHIVIGMAHHPLHLLNEFDRLPVQNRIEQFCHFFHCGHLHEPEVRNVRYTGAGCLMLAAGASFETRHSQNTYSFVTLDLLRGHRTIKTFQYKPTSGMFSFTSTEEYPVEVTPVGTCSIGELASAMKGYRTSLSPFANYLSAVLLEMKSEIPIPAQNGHIFGSLAVLQAQPDTDLKSKTINFMVFKNVLRVFYKRIPLSEIFGRYGVAVEQYGNILEEICNSQPEFKARLAEREKESQMLGSGAPQEAFPNTVALLEQLATEHEWTLLREQAERRLSSPDKKIAILAKRMLAQSLAHSAESADKAAAAEHYRSLIKDGSADSVDAKNLAILLIDAEKFEEARGIVLDGIVRFPANTADSFFQVGLKIVEATGDRKFRKRLETAMVGRGS